MNKINKILFLILFVLCAQITVISQTYDDFYYAFDQKVYLNIVSNKYVVEFPNGVDETLFTQNNLENEKLDTGIFEVSSNITTIQNVFGQSYYINPLYTTNDGLEISITREIVIRFNDGVSESEKADLINDYGLQLVESTRLFDLYQVANSLQISKEVFLSGLVEYCYPNFMCEATAFDGYHPNDEYYYKQYYLHNTGQLINNGHYGTADADIDAPEAWEITKGSSNITIAVIDDGVTDNHPDLPSSRQIRLSGSNFSSGDPNDPSPLWDFDLEVWENHGNCCAGIIGATQDNWEGVSGIAPQCKIMPIKVTLDSKSKTDEYSQAITFAFDHGANIISNSWGFLDQNPYLIPALRTAIEDAIEGGCLVIFAAGNEADQNNYDIGYVIFPANIGVPGLITVAASDRDDLQANYSPTSEMIDVSAPSSTDANNVDEDGNVWTMDYPGEDGWNPWPYSTDYPPLWEELPNSGTNYLSYTGRMSGTSAAAPQVAGCAALALSVNPNLSIGQINDLIRFKSDKVGGYNYDFNYLMPGHSNELGYGRLNCFKMVETAASMVSPNFDLYTKDLEEDFGIEPNEAEGAPMWISPDIWIRNQNDGIANQVTQNPEYGSIAYVYVRVTNIGATPSSGGQVMLYWAKASADLAWPEHWDGSIIDPLMGAMIGQANIPQILPGKETIITLPWSSIPDPALYEGVGDNPWHFCILSRIVSGSDPMATPEGSSVYQNTFNNNNIAWKNVTLAGGKNNSRNPGGVIAMGNSFGEPTTFDIELYVPKPCAGHSILDEAEVRVIMDDLTYAIWVAGGKQGVNISEQKYKQFIITGDYAMISNLTYDIGESSTLFVGFNFLTDQAETNKNIFKYMVTQKRSSDQMIIGGELYIIHKPPRDDDDLFDADAGADKNISKDESVVINAESIGEEAEYNWYDMEDSLIYSGSSLNVTLDTTTQYRLEVLAVTDGFKDYDEVTVNVKQYEITGIVPNPATNLVTIDYDVTGVSSAYLLITKPYDPATDTFILNISQNQIVFDVSGYDAGLYGVILVCNDQIVDQKLLLVQ